jgi:hypothetical protein
MFTAKGVQDIPVQRALTNNRRQRPTLLLSGRSTETEYAVRDQVVATAISPAAG